MEDYQPTTSSVGGVESDEGQSSWSANGDGDDDIAERLKRLEEKFAKILDALKDDDVAKDDRRDDDDDDDGPGGSGFRCN